MGVGESIKNGHDEYRRIFAKLFKSSENDADLRAKLFLDYEKKLYAHHEAEELTLIPAMIKVADLKDIGFQLETEHAAMKMLISELKKMGYDHRMWKYKLSPLYSVMKVHWDKEEAEIIPFAPEYFSTQVLDELGKKFDAFVDKHMKEH